MVDLVVVLLEMDLGLKVVVILHLFLHLKVITAVMLLLADGVAAAEAAALEALVETVLVVHKVVKEQDLVDQEQQRIYLEVP